MITLGVTAPILQPVSSTIAVPAIKRFAFSEGFRDGPNGRNEVAPILRTVFGGIIEHNVPAASVRAYDLLRPATELAVRSRLGRPFSMKFAHIHHLISQQMNGEPGDLLLGISNGNLFPIDANHTVFACWGKTTGWFVTLVPRSDRDPWSGRWSNIRAFRYE